MLRIHVLAFGFIAQLASAQTKDPAAIYLDLLKLNTVGSVLYVGAHPEDENTELIATLENGYHVRTAYLSLTRGENGKNLIGPEKNEELGILRTLEALAAREIDGAEQFYTRAVDFGYSKSADETFAMWGHDEILSDIVWIIRKFQPDVIISRFPPAQFSTMDDGHHQACGILVEEAFHAAGDREQFPEQLHYHPVWQAKRLYWDVSGHEELLTRIDTTAQVFIDVGAYDPLLGESYASLAGRARSMFKSQGAAISPRLGSWKQRLAWIAGEKAQKDLFDGIDLSWNRIEGGEKVGQLLQQAIEEFDLMHPDRTWQHLMDIHVVIGELKNHHWRGVAQDRLRQLVEGVCGLQVATDTDKFYATGGSTVDVEATLVNGSEVWLLAAVGLPRFDGTPPGVRLLEKDLAARVTLTKEIPIDLTITIPYWLSSPRSKYGRYEIKDADVSRTGEAWNEAEVIANLTLAIGGGRQLDYNVPITYNYTDPIKGPRSRPFIIMPAVTAEFDNDFYFFPDSTWKTVNVTLKGWADESAGEVALAGAAGWKASPSRYSFKLKKGEEVTFPFRIGPKMWNTAVLAVTINGELAYSAVDIDYDHIEPTVWLPNTGAIVSCADVKITAKKVGYIMGSGDQVPVALEQLGCEVTMITEENFDRLDLQSFDAIVTGVRAWNVVTWLPSKYKKLMSYVSKGGNLIVQYVTPDDLLAEQIGPYPLKIGNARVTNEGSPIGFNAPSHPILTSPNKMTPFDFHGWVQERGLCFAESWDDRYQSVLATNDPDEEVLNGGLLTCTYGEGTFVYTGLSFFRQLPVGNTGAYRLWANILSYKP